MMNAVSGTSTSPDLKRPQVLRSLCVSVSVSQLSASNNNNNNMQQQRQQQQQQQQPATALDR